MIRELIKQLHHDEPFQEKWLWQSVTWEEARRKILESIQLKKQLLRQSRLMEANDYRLIIKQFEEGKFPETKEELGRLLTDVCLRVAKFQDVISYRIGYDDAQKVNPALSQKIIDKFSKPII